MKLVEWNEQHQVIKYNPLLNWDEQSVADLIAKYHIPTNPLLQKGYRSIGCLPCTRAVDSEENARAGRWWWETSHKECGLHLLKS
jgi:phosphoadenosine phosphosulfate reductase